MREDEHDGYGRVQGDVGVSAAFSRSDVESFFRNLFGG
jgi:hypothetical protein